MIEGLLPFPFCPLQASYSAQFGTGVISTALDGGPSFRRLDFVGVPHRVSATWVLSESAYCAFMGFMRIWERSGGDPFSIELPLESSDMEDYEATFVPGSLSLTGKNAGFMTVTGQLEVLPKYLDPANDPCACVAMLSAYCGDQLCAAIRIVDRVANQNLVFRG